MAAQYTEENTNTKYPLSVEVKPFQGKPCFYLKSGGYSVFQGGQKWSSVFGQDTQGDSVLLEVVKFLERNKNEEELKTLHNNVETFIRQYLDYTQADI